MDNDLTPGSVKPLKNSLCVFCAFVRGRGGIPSPHAYTGAGGHPPIHNNKNNNNIYIKEVAGVPSHARGIA